MERDLTERLNVVAEHYNVRTYADFARKTNLTHQSASNYLKGNQKPDADNLAQIILSFDGLNGHWLITGEGEMLIKKDKVRLTPEVMAPYFSRLENALARVIIDMGEIKDTVKKTIKKS